ncbi:Fungal specific transcription factor domain [Ceratobasidium sp. AG-Ba]|nr:Fungal specific transcription factor domain [Ceratobasidium sp. AG-Ba]
MKCVFGSNQNICQRCQNTNKSCVVEGRKPRQGPNKRELLMRELANKDQIIDSLLRQIHNPAMRTPINLPPNVPIPQQTSNAHERPPDKDVLAWIESIRQNRPPTPTGSIDTGMAHHRRAASEPVLPPPPPTEPDEDAVSFGGSASNVKPRPESPENGQPRTPIELRQDSAELDDKLHSIPPPNAPVGFIAKLALTTNRDKRGSDAGMTGEAEEEDKWVGVGNMTYFEAGPSADPELRRIIIERQMPPEILTHGIIKPAEVEVLFKIFFEQLNPFVAILDPSMHTPAFVFGRCPFLFTAICAISSRYYRKRPELYTIAMHFAKQSAATALIDGWKSVELVQAYILMSVYPVPARRWEEDRTWLYLGLAIRMATDLNLHLPWQGKATGEAHEREILNRTRTWLICFNLDRSGATQFGRPPTIREDYIIRKSQDWYKRSEYNLTMDVHLTAYTRLLRIVARFLANVYSDSNSPTALNKSLDFMTVTTASDEELMAYERETQEQFEKESDHNDSACEYRCHLLPFLSNYSRLVIFSFGYQQAFQRGLQHGKVFFDKCYKAASEVVRIAIEVLAPSGRLMYAPDGHFVFISFAAAFLLKMLRPQFAAALEPTQSSRIIQIVTRLADVLASDKVAIDDRHSPRLYSRFLSGLIAKQNQNGMMLSKPLQPGPQGGAGAAGSSGSASSKPGMSARSVGGTSTSGTSGAGLTSNTSTSANATDAGMIHESPHTAPLELASEAEEARDKVSSPPRPRRMQSPPIVIRPPTIDQSMHNVNRPGELASPLRQGATGQDQTLMGGYVTVEPSGETMSSVESTAQGGETTITDASGNDMEYDKHDMLAAMYALQDPSWYDNFLMPGFNANFRDDGSSSSSEMRQWYNMNPGAIIPGGGTGQGTMGALGAGHGLQGMGHVPDLFAPGLDYTQGMMMNGQDTQMDNMMDGYGYR